MKEEWCHVPIILSTPTQEWHLQTALRTLRRLESINRTLLNGLNAPYLSSINSNSIKHEVLAHPPNHPLRPLRLVLPGAKQQFSSLCRFLRQGRSDPDRMQYVYLLHLHYAASLSYLNTRIAELIRQRRHVSVPTNSSSNLRLLACC
jgi:hypothetical protein